MSKQGRVHRKGIVEPDYHKFNLILPENMTDEPFLQDFFSALQRNIAKQVEMSAPILIIGDMGFKFVPARHYTDKVSGDIMGVIPINEEARKFFDIIRDMYGVVK